MGTDTGIPWFWWWYGGKVYKHKHQSNMKAIHTTSPISTSSFCQTVLYNHSLYESEWGALDGEFAYVHIIQRDTILFA